MQAPSGGGSTVGPRGCHDNEVDALLGHNGVKRSRASAGNISGNANTNTEESIIGVDKPIQQRPNSDDTSSLIKEWQQRTSSDLTNNHFGMIARLYRGLLDLFSSLLKTASLSSTLPKRLGNALRRNHAMLKLWADGHGILEGKLDDVLEKSKILQYTTLATLNSLCAVLLHRLSRIVFLGSNKARLTLIQQTNAGVLYDQTKYVLAGLEDTISDSGSDSESSEDSSSADKPEDVVLDIKTYVQCLIDLSGALECPATDPVGEEDKPSMPKLEKRGAYDYYADLIIAKYPKANISLAQCLGKANWERYQRMQLERAKNTEPGLRAQTTASKSEFAETFQDSGLGSSIPTRGSTYAETVITLISSISGDQRIEIPPLPPQAKEGEKFECIACGKRIRAVNNREWRRHLYTDLRPYTCFHPACTFSVLPFRDRRVWSDHLDLDHRLGPQWKNQQCPLCLEFTGSGKSVIMAHYARHMEEIALAALPREIDSEANSDAESDVESEARSSVSHLSNDKHSLSSATKLGERVPSPVIPNSALSDTLTHDKPAADLMSFDQGPNPEAKDGEDDRTEDGISPTSSAQSKEEKGPRAPKSGKEAQYCGRHSNTWLFNAELLTEADSKSAAATVSETNTSGSARDSTSSFIPAASWIPYPDPDSMLSTICETCSLPFQICSCPTPTMQSSLFSDLQHLDDIATTVQPSTVQVAVEDTYTVGDRLWRQEGKPPQPPTKRLAPPRDGFSCPAEGCVRTFNRFCDLRRHEKTHIPRSERPHKCSVCNEGFLYPRDLKRHQRVHVPSSSARVMFYCDIPGCVNIHGFTRRENLLRHQRRQHFVEAISGKV